jgi:hypothetical protein
MTEDEHIKLVEVGNSFWDKLGSLIADHVAQMPKHLEGDTLNYLQDKCSVFGTEYDKYLRILQRA